MRKIFSTLLLLVAYVYATACTNFIVGKKASADGSVFTTYNADDYGMFIGLCHFPAAKHAKGEMRQIYDWDTKEYHGQIPENTRFQSERQLSEDGMKWLTRQVFLIMARLYT